MCGAVATRLPHVCHTVATRLPHGKTCIIRECAPRGRVWLILIKNASAGQGFQIPFIFHVATVWQPCGNCATQGNTTRVREATRGKDLEATGHRSMDGGPVRSNEKRTRTHAYTLSLSHNQGHDMNSADSGTRKSCTTSASSHQLINPSTRQLFNSSTHQLSNSATR